MHIAFASWNAGVNHSSPCSRPTSLMPRDHPYITSLLCAPYVTVTMSCHSIINATYQYRLPLDQPSTSPSIQTSFMDVPLHHTMPHVFALLSPSTRTFTPNDPTKRRVSELSTMRTNIGSTFIRHGERERRVDGWLVTELEPKQWNRLRKKALQW